MSSNVTKLQAAHDAEPISIAKPAAFSLDRFKSKQEPNLGNVETLQAALPVHSIAQANDFVRLHPDEDNYWSFELCFVSVPIKGATKDSLHLIDEDVAVQHLPSARVKRFRLALAAKPGDRFFLCRVPSQNLDNLFNSDNLRACHQAMTHWTQATSRVNEGVDGYKIEVARDPDALGAPKWPTQPLAAMVETTFSGRSIMDASHPGLLRLVGAKQSLE